jgi:tetratricopeptide (TPR) repeat protein
MQGLDALVHQTPQVAVDHLQKAVILDTEFVEAKIWLLEQADVLGNQALVDSISRAAVAQRSRLGAFDQISLDRELAFLHGRWEDAYSASRRLVAIVPNTPDAQVYLAQAAMATRRYPEAVAILHRIDRKKGWLKDLAQLTQWDLQAHRLMGDDAGAVKEWREAFNRAPEDYGICNAGIIVLAAAGKEQEVDALIQQCAGLQGAPQTVDRAYEVAGRGYRSRGHAAAARRAFERALAIRTAVAKADPRRRRGVGLLQCELGEWQMAYETLRSSYDSSSLDDRTALGVAAAHVGDTVTVNSTLRWMDEWRRRETPRGQDKMSRAFIAVARGDRGEAIRLLRQSIEEGAAPAWSAWYVRFELQPLRGDPRFEELIRSQT